MAYYDALNAQPDPVAANAQTSEEIWPVEAISRARFASDQGEVVIGRKKIPGTWDYFVKWAGFDESHNTWEPQANLTCPRLIKEFWDEFEFPEGFRSVPYTGHVKATKEWVAFQKEYFSNRYTVEISHPQALPTEEEVDPQKEAGSSTEEEEGENRKKKKAKTKAKTKSRAKSKILDLKKNKRAEEPSRTGLVIRIPAAKPKNGQAHERVNTPSKSDSRAESRNAYPSPMSIDDHNA